MEDMLPYVWLGLGVLARMIIPWLLKLYKGADMAAWDWKYLYGQLIGAAIVFFAIPVLIGDLEAVAKLGFQAAFMSGYAAADIGRLMDKAARA